MWKIVWLLITSMFILGCQPGTPLHDFYTPKEQRLAQILNHCKANGMHYATTNSLCKAAAEKGIYWDLPQYYAHCCCCVDKR